MVEAGQERRHRRAAGPHGKRITGKERTGSRMGRIGLWALTIPMLLAAQAALGQNCLINYKFDQSGSTKSITDSSGASRTGTVVSAGTGGAWWSSTYKFGSHSLRFGSATGYATYATIPDISGTFHGFTIATWVYPRFHHRLTADLRMQWLGSS